MSLFHNRISWNDVKKLVEDFTGRTVDGDGEAVLLHYDDLTAIQAQTLDHQYVYFGDVYINDDSFGDEHIFQYVFEDDTSYTTLSIPTTGVASYGNVVKNVLFNKISVIPMTAGCTHVLAYKMLLKTDLGEIYTYSDATLPVTGWSKVGTTYTHVAGTANTLSFALSLPAGNYILHVTATITAGTLDFGTDELGSIIQLSGAGVQTATSEFYSTGTGTILACIPSSNFVGSFTEANIYIQNVIYS